MKIIPFDKLIIVHLLFMVPDVALQVMDGYHRMNDHIALSIFVLLDGENPESFFYPFHCVLPRAFDHVPVFWSDSQLQVNTISYLSWLKTDTFFVSGLLDPA